MLISSVSWGGLLAFLLPLCAFLSVKNRTNGLLRGGSENLARYLAHLSGVLFLFLSLSGFSAWHCSCECWGRYFCYSKGCLRSKNFTGKSFSREEEGLKDLGAKGLEADPAGGTCYSMHRQGFRTPHTTPRPSPETPSIKLGLKRCFCTRYGEWGR